MILEALVLASAVAGPATHTTTIEHRGAPVAITYRADTVIKHRQVGSVAPPGRPSSLRCLWTATVSVHRQAEHGGAPVAALSRRIASQERLSGSRPGGCAQARRAIAREAAARGAVARDHLIEVAERDRADVHAELESVQAFTGRLG